METNETDWDMLTWAVLGGFATATLAWVGFLAYVSWMALA